ncbi:MAG: hypothetical protein ACFFCI_00950 [Promethearchaeota archaeon]
MEMYKKKTYWNFAGFFIGFFGFLIFPFWFKIIPFLVCIFILAYTYSSKNDRFNIHVFLMSLLVFVFLASSVFTFDASKPLDAQVIYAYVSSGAVTIAIISFIGIPIVLIGMIVLCVILGKLESVVRGIMLLVVIIAVGLGSAFALAYSGWDMFGIGEFITEFYSGVIAWLMEAPIQGYETIYTIANSFGLDLPEIPKNRWFRNPERVASEQGIFGDQGGIGGSGASTGNSFLDTLLNGTIFNQGASGGGGGDGGGVDIFGAIGSAFGGMDTMRTLGYNELIYGIHDCLPLIAGLICLVSAFFHLKKDWAEEIEDWITQISEDSIVKREKEEIKHFKSAKLKLAIIWFIIFFCGWGIALSFTNSFGVDESETYRMILYLSIYSTIITGSIFLLMTYLGDFYTDAGFKNTLKGFLYGIGGLFLLRRLFFTQQVIGAYDSCGVSKEVAYIWLTFTFIAPAESFFFHVVWLAIVFAILAKFTKDVRAEDIELSREASLQALKQDANLSLRVIQVYKHLAETADNAKERKIFQDELINEEKRLRNITKETKRLKTVRYDVRIFEDSIFGRRNATILYYLFGPILGSIGFASLHWFILSHNVDYFEFITSGMFFIYFSGGCWFSIISRQYGYGGCILSHAFYNVSTILMYIFFTA